MFSKNKRLNSQEILIGQNTYDTKLRLWTISVEQRY